MCLPVVLLAAADETALFIANVLLDGLRAK
jgi:hypothetical protein